MKVVFTREFQERYLALSSDAQRRVDRTIRLLASRKGGSAFHPGLHARHVKGTVDIWEARVTLKYRLTFQVHQGTLYLRVVGDHDPILKKP
jgi:mRNA-degrading endonuclease RelE of RelBE toxin-antitoxin system